MSVLRGWLEQWLSWDRRRSERQAVQGVVAYYWTGAVSVGKSVRDISLKGLYLLTEDRWYPGTMIRITLQRTDDVEEGSKRAITVQAKVIRSDIDGVGFAFVLPRMQEELDRQYSVADRKSLEQFLVGLATRS